MAATFDPSQIMTNDFYQDFYSEDLSPSSKDIERVLGIKMERELADFIDSITAKEAGELLDKLLKENLPEN